jgi:DNA-binding MarR family transcriptional regulator
MDEQPHWLGAQEQRDWRSFVRLHQKLSVTLVRDLQAHSKLSGADFEILVALTDVPDGRLRITELARAIDWEQSRLSHQTSRMIKRGLLAREDCADDGRGVLVTVTPAGRAAIEAAAPRHVAMVRRYVVDVLSPAELATLGRLSRRILDGLDDAAGSTT